MLAILALGSQPARPQIVFICRDPNLEVACVLVVLFAVKAHIFPGGLISFGRVRIAVFDETIVGFDLDLVVGHRRILRPHPAGRKK